MVTNRELAAYLHKLLKVDTFKDFAPNGLQIEGREEIHKLFASTSATKKVITECSSRGADALLVHHGWFWSNENRTLVGPFKEKIKLMLDNEINLFGYHLPLDALPELGNNHPVLKSLGVAEPEVMFEIGYVGELAQPKSVADFQQELDKYYGREGVHVFPENVSEVKKIAIVSGNGTDFFRELLYHKEGLQPGYEGLVKDVDAYITGEGTEWVYSLVHDFGVGYSAMGHYTSEKIGPTLLGQHLAEKFSLEFEFIDDPNPF